MEAAGVPRKLVASADKPRPILVKKDKEYSIWTWLVRHSKLRLDGPGKEIVICNT